MSETQAAAAEAAADTKPAASPAEMQVIAVATIYVTDQPAAIAKDGKVTSAPTRRAIKPGQPVTLPTQDAARLLVRGLVRAA